MPIAVLWQPIQRLYHDLVTGYYSTISISIIILKNSELLNKGTVASIYGRGPHGKKCLQPKIVYSYLWEIL